MAIESRSPSFSWYSRLYSVVISQNRGTHKIQVRLRYPRFYLSLDPGVKLGQIMRTNQQMAQSFCAVSAKIGVLVLVHEENRR